MRKRKAVSKGRETGAKPRSSRHPPAAGDQAAGYWIYGAHAVLAALANPERRCRRLVTAREAAAWQGRLAELAGARADLAGADSLPRAELERLLPAGAVGQGLALLVDPLPHRSLGQILAAKAQTAPAAPRRLLVALDQVTDPQNVGAVLRSAAAFGAAGLVVPERHSAPESGALAKAASGALDILPMARVSNLARALDDLKTAGFWCVGLAQEAEAELGNEHPGEALVLVLGAEGKGLRRLTRERCDLLVRLPTRGAIASLNVSNACAVALYALLSR